VTRTSIRRPARGQATSRCLAGVAAAALLATLSGCAEVALPQPRPASAEEHVPVAGAGQLDSVLTSVTTTLTSGDEVQKADALVPAVDGAALEQRTGSYLVKSKVPDSAYAIPLGAERLQDLVPVEQGWPRSVLSVTRATPEDQFPDLMLLTQQGPREGYKLSAYAPMLPGAELPLTEPLKVGVPVPAIDDKGDLLMSPADAAAGYADVLSKGTASKAAASFGEDSFRTQVLTAQDAERKALTAACKGCFTYSAAHAVRPEQVWAFGTQDGGAMVMAVMTGSNSFKVAIKGSKANLHPEYAALAGTKTAKTRGDFTYVEVIGMYIPPASAEGTVQVLAGQRVPLSGKAA
jgi:hypothetical protein